MKVHKSALAVALLLASAFMVAPATYAQMGLTYTSSIQVQNLSASVATISIQFYDQASGAAAATTIGDTIAAGANKAYFPLPSGLGSFNGSAVISSDQPVAAITNLLGNGGAYADSAIGVAQGATSVGLPLVMKANSGFSTFLNVQNTGATDAHVTVNYTPGTAGTAASQTATIKAGAAHTFDQSTNAALGAKFIGSGTVTSDQPVAVTVSQVGAGSIKTMMLYNGFSGGTTTAQAPLVMANNSGYFTSLNIQNVGSAATTVTVHYGPNLVGAFTPHDETLSLNANQGGNLLQASGQWTSRYVGSATVSSSAAQPVVVVVNELKIGSPSQGSAYAGFNPSTLTMKASAPLLMSNNGGYLTSVQCQNAGTTTAHVTVTYSANTVGSGTPAADARTLAPGASTTIFQAPGVDPKWTARYVGSGAISADQNVACIVNELGPSTGDTLLTYNAINY